MKPSPAMLAQIDPANAPHWEAARRGELAVQCCVQCAAARLPCAPVCTACGSAEHIWRTVGRGGRVLSWCRFHKPYFKDVAVPYAVLLVELDCGLRIFANPCQQYEGGPNIGDAIEIVFDTIENGTPLMRVRKQEGAA
ncbi:Zn-ribbon domain-containing OB-fold protein [Bordetella sp. BOR01]|uniref:Zn-ribbon domain-containing OB-fold protein n=1 Tax=Bordetella sp. BOR01 TaxID=2854779 RepID=UPI001C439411|nr:OB-fold domain-containing protein [Bordetella sp. BOR01]MBV7482113.1 OB-fold domain-containing protein [Bordetella sp. BOR01]